MKWTVDGDLRQQKGSRQLKKSVKEVSVNRGGGVNTTFHPVCGKRICIVKDRFLYLDRGGGGSNWLRETFKT